MDFKFILIILVCGLIFVHSKPTENRQNNTSVLGGYTNYNYKLNTNARALRLKNEGNNIKIQPIRPVKPCALIGGDCSEEAWEVVWKLEQQRRFGDDYKDLKSNPDLLDIFQNKSDTKADNKKDKTDSKKD